MFYIYELIDPRTNETRYIGQTINVYDRLHSHFSEAKKRNSYKNIWLRKLLREGVIPILNVIDEIESDVYFWEKFYIDLYMSWNIRLTNIAISVLGGGDTFTNDPNKEKRRQRQSEISKAYYANPEARKKTKIKSIEIWKDPKLIEQARKYGKLSAELHKENKVEWMKKRWLDNPELAEKIKNASILARSIAIEQINENGNVIAEFISGADAARKLNLYSSDIYNVVNHKRKHIRGLRFRKKIIL